MAPRPTLPEANWPRDQTRKLADNRKLLACLRGPQVAYSRRLPEQRAALPRLTGKAPADTNRKSFGKNK